MINTAFYRELDAMNAQIEEDSSFLSDREKLVAGAAIGFSFSAIAGYILWALRGITLAASAVTALPMWRFFDPLAVVAPSDKKNGLAKAADDQDDDRDDEEKDLKRILEPTSTSTP